MNSNLTDTPKADEENKKQKLLLEGLESIVSLAVDSMQKGDFKHSLDFFEKAFEAFPSSLVIQYGIAVSKMHLKEYDEAIGILRNILSKDKTNAEYWTLIGIVYMRKGLLKEAEQSFREADSFSSDKTQTEYNLGFFYYSVGRLEDAKKAYEQCIKRNHEFLDGYFGLALVLEDLKNYDGAAKTYEEIIKNDSSLEEAWFGLGAIYVHMNDRKKAIEYYSKSVEINPSNATAWSTLGACYAYLKDYENSVRCFRESLRNDYTFPTAWFNLGTSYCVSGSLERGIMCLEEAVRLNPLHQDAWTNLASAYLDCKNVVRAIEIYKKSLEIDPENGLALRGMLGACIKLIQERGIESGETTITAIISDIPTAYYLFNDLGVELARQRRFKDAIRFFKTSVSLKKDFGEGWFNLGFTYADLQDHTNVIDSYNRYLEIDSQNKHAWNNLGNAYFKTKRTDDSLRCYDEALKIDPAFVEALANKANSLASADKFSEAIQLCKRAVELAPSNAHGWLVYGEAMFLTGRYEEAIKYLSEARKIDPSTFSSNAFLGLAFLKTRRFEEAIELLEPINASGDFSGIIGSAYAMMQNYEKAIRYFENTDIEKTGLRKELVEDLSSCAGLSYLREEDYTKAIRYLSRANEIKGNNVEILAALGVAYLRTGEFEQAAGALEHALEIDASNESVLNNLSFAYWKMKAYPKMARTLSRQTEIDPRKKQTWDNLGTLYLNHLFDFEKAVGAFSESRKLSPKDPKTVLPLAEALTCVENRKGALELIDGLLEEPIDPEYSCLSYFLLMCVRMLQDDTRPNRELLSKFLESYDAMKSKKVFMEFSGLYKVIERSNVSLANKELVWSLGNLLRGKRDKGTVVSLLKYTLS